jgi:putative tricarboxylic transport membrane protein
MFIEGFLAALSIKNLTYLLIGSILGLLIGAAPGLGPVFGLALLLSMTFRMTAEGAIIFLSAVYASCVFGGSISAILLNTPGTPGSVATTFDGHAMSKKGEPGKALGIALMSSFIGGLIGVFSLMFLGPPLARVSLLIGPAEYFMLAVVGLSLVSIASKGNTLKGLAMCGLGLMLTFVGRCVVTGVKRFTFGTIYLEDGIQFVPFVIGAFAFAQTMVLANEIGIDSDVKIKTNVSGIWEGFIETLRRPISVLRSAIIGTFIGALPGLGINAANFIAYVVEKNSSKNPVEFGSGVSEGIIASETANNAVTSSALIPAFALGVPGSSTAALFLSAMMIHGLQPGYAFFETGGARFATIIIGMILAQVTFFLLGWFGGRYFVRITQVPNSLLAPIIMVLCFVGSYSYRGQFADILVMLIAGILGYYLEKNKYPLGCLILGMILGPLAEDNFSRAMRLSRGSASIFFTRPISLVLVIIIVLSFIIPVIRRKWNKKLKVS